jgi:RecA-family ATPase
VTDQVPDLQAKARHLRDTDQPSRADQFASKLLNFAELLDLPAPDPLVDGLLYRDSLAVIFGPSGGGKTFLACDLAWCVAGDLPWQGRNVHHGPVLYVLGEGRGGIGQRARAWITAFGTDQPKAFQLYPEAVNLLDPDQVATLAEWAAAYQPVLVVLDTLARSMPGGDENSARDMGVMIAGADTIRRASGACVLLIHHTGKDGLLERGTRPSAPAPTPSSRSRPKGGS